MIVTAVTRPLWSSLVISATKRLIPHLVPMNAEGRHAAELLGEAGSGSAGRGNSPTRSNAVRTRATMWGLVVLDAVQRRGAKSSGS